MSNPVFVSDRDRGLLRFLEMTPATAVQVRKASVTFSDEPFRDERRTRERLQALTAAGLVQASRAAVGGGGLMHYYRLTVAGCRALNPDERVQVGRSHLSEIAPTRFRHAMITTDVIVHTLIACQNARIRVLKFHGDGRLTLAVGEHRQQPDCHFQFEQSGRVFNVLFEIDNATEPIDSARPQSIDAKLRGYEAYQDWVWENWKRAGAVSPRPYFRVVFLTTGIERAMHVLWWARRCARNPDRRLCYASTQEAYFAEPRAVTAPLFNDHHGNWQSLVNLHPSSCSLREPVRVSSPLARSGPV